MADKERAEVGDLVYWYPDGDRHQEAHAAVVTRVGLSGLALNIFSPDNWNLRCRDGVRHLDDPACRSAELREAGGWEHTPRMRRLLELCGGPAAPAAAAGLERPKIGGVR